MNQPSKHKSTKNTNWTILLLSFACVLVAYVPFAYTERISDEIWAFRFIYAFALFGVLPTAIVFYLSEFILKKSLNFENKKISDQLAVVYGFVVGLTLVLMAMPLLWKYYNDSIGCCLSFLEFLFPKDLYFLDFQLRVNLFLLPNIINVISSPYMGWKINKAKSVETTLVTKE